MPKISIVMPVYNGAKYLEKSLESVSRQTFKDVEVICVDDGSTDDSLKVLDELKAKYDFIKVISQENQGSGKARNTGLKNASGDYIAFLDADDIYVDEKALEEMYGTADKNDADVVSANIAFIKKDYSLFKNRHYERGDYMYFKESGTINPDDYGIPYAFYKNIFKREFLEKHNIVFPDLLRGQDPVFLSEVFANTSVIYVCPLDFYGYNYSVGGGVNHKMNNYLKKKSYVKHFRDSCDILAEADLKKTSDEYKLHLTKYLNWKKNNRDEDLFKIYGEIFPDNIDYFDGTDENYVIFNAAAQSYLLYHSEDEDNFKNVKKSLLDIDESILPKHIKEKYDIITSSDSLTDYKKSYHKDRMEKLEIRNKKLTDKIDELTEENEKLEEKLESLKEDVKTVRSSSTFKFAKKVKDIIK